MVLHEFNSQNVTVESKLIPNNHQVSLIFKSLGAHVQMKHHFQWTNNPSRWKLKEDLLPPLASLQWAARKENMWDIMIKNKDLRYNTSRAKRTQSTCQPGQHHLPPPPWPTGLPHKGVIAAETQNRTFWVPPGWRGGRWDAFVKPQRNVRIDVEARLDHHMPSHGNWPEKWDSLQEGHGTRLVPRHASVLLLPWGVWEQVKTGKEVGSGLTQTRSTPF